MEINVIWLIAQKWQMMILDFVSQITASVDMSIITELFIEQSYGY